MTRPTSPEPTGPKNARAVVAIALIVVSGTAVACAPPPPPTRTSTTTTSSPTTSVSAPPSGNPTEAGGRPVPAGFEAVSYTAVSADEFWLLGSVPCASSSCTTIIRTTDGGAHFMTIPAPPAPVTGAASGDTAGLIDTLRFSDPSDGYALGEHRSGSATDLWVTHDGGGDWSSVALGTVETFDISTGEAYAVVGRCGKDGCTDVHLERSAATTDTWTATTLPGVASSPTSSISAQGRQVWINAETGGGAGEVLLHSSDGGASFTSGPSPCVAGLGGSVQATGDGTLWFMCPTGNLASAQRSVDAGASFQVLDTGPIANASEIAGADASTALLADGAGPALRRTDDGGASFPTVFTPPDATGWLYLGFTSPTVGVGLSADENSAPSALPITTLWRTVDSGLTWQRVT